MAKVLLWHENKSVFKQNTVICNDLLELKIEFCINCLLHQLKIINSSSFTQLAGRASSKYFKESVIALAIKGKSTALVLCDLNAKSIYIYIIYYLSLPVCMYMQIFCLKVFRLKIFRFNKYSMRIDNYNILQLLKVQWTFHNP